MRHKQRGITLTGFLVGAIIFGFIALTGAKVVPAYMEFRSVKAAMDAAVSASSGAREASVADIRESLTKRLSINYVESIKAKDIKITKSNGGYRVAVDYQAEKPYVGNIYLLIKFQYETETR